ncbi:MAG: TolC family protein [Bdellovibrio sp.]|nr:TolC family protein [Bdellovibrio sp.]
MRSVINLLTLVAWFASITQAKNSTATQQSLAQYLKQVRENHQGYLASEAIKTGTTFRMYETNLPLAPTFFSTIQLASDAKASPFLSYAKLITNTYSVGLSQTTRFGLQAKFSYNLYYTDYVGLKPSYYEGKPILELNQSFLRNSFGAETRALEETQKAVVQATHFGESFKMKLLLADAESTYWKLFYSQRNIIIQKDALIRAQKIYDWCEKRARLRLADQADLLQAKAALETRKLQLEMAINEERSNTLSFNQMRGGDQTDIITELQDTDLNTLINLIPAKSSEPRDDIKAASVLEQAAYFNAELMRERDKPVLEAFATLSLNGRNYTTGEALRDSFKIDQPTAAVGLRFSVPLDFGTIQNSRTGWLNEQKAAELIYQRKQFDLAQEWSDLTSKFEESKKRLILSQAIENAQRQKLFYEKDRLTRGRSTTYQVLLFEQDYAQSQITRLQIQTEILQINAKMKLFGVQS